MDILTKQRIADDAAKARQEKQKSQGYFTDEVQKDIERQKKEFKNYSRNGLHNLVGTHGCLMTPASKEFTKADEDRIKEIAKNQPKCKNGQAEWYFADFRVIAKTLKGAEKIIHSKDTELIESVYGLPYLVLKRKPKKIEVAL